MLTLIIFSFYLDKNVYMWYNNQKGARMGNNLTAIKQDKEYREYVKTAIEFFNTNGKKTVVYFCDCYYPTVDGVVKVLENYAINVSNEFNVVIIAPKHKRRIVQDDNNFLLIGVSGLFVKMINYNLALPKLDSRLKPFLDRLKIDIIHAHSPFPIGAYGASYAKRHNIPFVMTMHSQYKLDFIRYVNSEKVATLMTKHILKVFNKSVETWTMNKKTAEVLKSYGYDGKIHLIPNATDYPKPENLEELRKIGREKYGIPDSTKVLLFVGRLVKQKNIIFIADVLKKVKDAGITFKAIFVGDGPDEDALKSRIAKNGIADDTILTGRINDRNDLSIAYAVSDLFLFPSLYDMSSIVQIEAAGHKLPGVFIDGTPTANTITHNETGFLAKNDLEEFSKVVIDVLRDDELLKTVSNNAEEKLYVTWEDLTARICKRYNYLIENNPKEQ